MLRNFFIKNFFFKKNRTLIILFVFCFLVKVNNFFFINNLSFVPIDYFKTLDNNFFEYFKYSHTQPLFIVIFDAVRLKISYYIDINIKYLFYIINAFTTFLLIFFLNKIFGGYFRENMFLNFLIILLIIAISPFDVWRISHHDHINFFIIILLTYSVANRLLFEKQNEKFIFCLIFILTNSYTMGVVLSFLTLLFLFIYNLVFLKTNFFIKYFFIFLICIFPFFKNFYYHGAFSSSTMMGANLIQRSLHAIGHDDFRKIVLSNKDLPNWWKNCFEDIYLNQYDQNNIDAFRSRLAHGNCYKQNKKNKFSDFNLYLNNIKNIPENSEAIFEIKKDIQIYKEKNWIFDAEYYESTPNIARLYQSYGSKLFWLSLKNYPQQMFVGKVGKKGFVLTFAQMLSSATLFPSYYENNFVNWNFLSISSYNILKVIFIILAFFLYLFFIYFLKKN